MHTIVVDVIWDDEAGVYVATSEDVYGFATEAPTLDKLKDRVLAILPELIEANGFVAEGVPGDVNVCIMSKFSERIELPA